MQRTIEWGNVAKRGKRMVNPQGKRSIGKTYPSTSGWLAEENSIGWKWVMYGTRSCSCKYAPGRNCFKFYGIFPNAHWRANSGFNSAGNYIFTYIYLLYFFNAGKDQNMWKYVEIVWGSMPTEKDLEIGKRVQRELNFISTIWGSLIPGKMRGQLQKKMYSNLSKSCIRIIRILRFHQQLLPKTHRNSPRVSLHLQIKGLCFPRLCIWQQHGFQELQDLLANWLQFIPGLPMK